MAQPRLIVLQDINFLCSCSCNVKHTHKLNNIDVACLGTTSCQVLSDDKKRLKYDKSGDLDLEDLDIEQFMNMWVGEMMEDGACLGKPNPLISSTDRRHELFTRWQ
eukprot:4248623-Amphidinium_carterae.1